MPDERTLAVGETLTLDLIVRDENGGANGAGTVQWSTDNPNVASVNVLGVVTGVGPGTATIRAEVEGITGSVRVTVATAPADCAATGALRSLPVGGSVTLGGVTAATVCLDGGAAGAEYVAVPFHGGNPADGDTTVFIGTQNIVPVSAASPSVAPALSLQTGPRPDEEWHLRMRQRAARELAPYVDEAIAAGRVPEGGMRPSYVLDLRNPAVGQQVQVNTSTEQSCEAPRHAHRPRGGGGDESVVLADLANPAGGLTDAEYAVVRGGLRHAGVPGGHGAFGESRDVDQNGRVVIFYTRAVNELTQGSGSYVGGYFHPRDLFPTRDRDGLSACATSNFAEMFYMLVPDPGGTVNGNVFSRELVLQTSLGTIAHEFQHLINASRRLYVIGTDALERADVAGRGHEPRAGGGAVLPRLRPVAAPEPGPAGDRGEPAGAERVPHLHGPEHPPVREVPGGAGGPVAVRLRQRGRQRPGHARRGDGRSCAMRRTARAAPRAPCGAR